jgi:hypothetical protein
VVTPVFAIHLYDLSRLKGLVSEAENSFDPRLGTGLLPDVARAVICLPDCLRCAVFRFCPLVPWT